MSETNRDASGAVLPALSSAAIDFAFGYTGADYDSDTNLPNHGARWYDASTGRWLSQDPIGFRAGNEKLYRYVGDGPNTKTGPSGTKEFVVTIANYFPSGLLKMTRVVKAEIIRVLVAAHSGTDDNAPWLEMPSEMFRSTDRWRGEYNTGTYRTPVYISPGLYE